MKPKIILLFAFTVALLAGRTVTLSAAEPAKADAALATKLIHSVAKSDYDAFTADWDDLLKPKLTKEPFAKTCALYTGRLQAGYEVTYLGDLSQAGCHVTLWKVSFNDQRDDSLVTLVARGGKVAGFWIK